MVIVAVIAAFAALRATYSVSMPLVFACFLAVLVWPLQKRLMHRLNKWLSFLIVVLLMAAALALFSGLIWFGASQLTNDGPAFIHKLEERAQNLQALARERGLSLDWKKLEPHTALNTAWAWITAGVASLWSAFALIGIVLVFLILLLAEADQWPLKVREAFRHERAKTVLQTARDIVRALQRYLVVRLSISALSGALVYAWCLLLRIELAFVWGLTTFAFNFVPNIGSIVSYAFPTLAAFVQYDWRWALLTLVCIAATDLVVANFLEPRLQGRSLRLSPFLVLVAVVFWGWMWGIGGMMLGVPITATLLIICEHVRALQPVARLLSKPRSQKSLNAKC
jgi:predicted PurR-regulated permease PerM